MPNAKNATANATPSILIVGDGGTGKTRFLGSCPSPFVIDCDKGMASVAGMDVEYRTFKDAPWGSKAINKEDGIYPWGSAWNELVRYVDDVIYPQIEAGTWPYKVLAFDSVTTLGNIAKNAILKQAGKTGKDQLEKQHWGQMLRQLEVFFEQVTSWPVISIFTAHIRRDENLVQGTTEYLPMIEGQLAGRLGIYFDEFYFTQTAGKGDARKFAFKTQAEGLYKQAKSRANVPDGVEANWSKLAPHLLKGVAQ